MKFNIHKIRREKCFQVNEKKQKTNNRIYNMKFKNDEDVQKCAEAFEAVFIKK